MFCPRCGASHGDEIKFCKTCGANLGSVRKAVESGSTGGTFDWSNTWVAEMLASSEEQVRRAKEIERLQGITPEVKRRNEIKAGVITASVGAAVSIFLFVLMQGIILGGDVKPGDAEILSRVWVAGIIPLFIGIALIVNGALVSTWFSKPHGKDELGPHVTDADRRQLQKPASGEYLPPAETSQLFPDGYSITEETTEHLKVPRERSRRL
ncbi:MAG TPA: hypothetical protein VHL50_09070 [Pyrinomonadaceae bacterium]|nr:hypothetical protein [Pyrinomonadaceae bacterium]